MSPTPRPAPFFFPRPHLLLLLAILLLPVGCAKVQPEPFAKFEATTGQASSLVAEIAKQDSSIIKKMFIAREAENPKFDPASIELQYMGNFNLKLPDDSHSTANYGPGSTEIPLASFKATPPNRTTSAPDLYLKSQSHELTLAGLNGAFAAYVRALSKLAAGQASWKVDLDASKAGFEAFLDKAAIPFPAIGKSGVSTNLAQLFELGFQAFLDYKQRRSLIDIIDAWQPVMDGYARQCQDALTWSSILYHDFYQITVYNLRSQLENLKLPPPPAKIDSKVIEQRAAIIEHMLDANNKLMGEFKAMVALYQFYALVPAAHDALGKNLKRHTMETSSLDTLIAAATNIVDLYKSSIAKSQAVQPTTTVSTTTR